MGRRVNPVRPKILILASRLPPDHSGAGRRAVRLARALARLGNDVAVATDTSTPSSIGPTVQLIQLKGLDWGHDHDPRSFKRYVTRAAGSISRARGLASGLGNQRGSTVALQIGAYFHTQLLGAACASMGIPVIGQPTLVGADDPVTISHGRLGNLRGRLFRSHPLVISISRRLHRTVWESGYPKARTVLVPSAPDSTRFRVPSATERDEARRRFGIEHDETTIVTVGKIEPRKGQMELLKAVRRIPAKRGKLRVLLVGPIGEDETSLAYVDRLTQCAGSSPEHVRISFTGQTDCPEEVLAAADLFALLSKNEGLPTVVLEALCCGLPVVMTRLPGVSDYIAEVVGQEALREVSVSDASIGLSKTLSYAKTVDRQAIRERVLSRFSPTKTYSQYNNILNGAVTLPGGLNPPGECFRNESHRSRDGREGMSAKCG